MRIAYLITRYPGASKVFLQREIAGLRERGADVLVVSVRRSTEVLSERDREEHARTLWLVPASPWALVRSQARAARTPSAWLGSLRTALRDAPRGLKAKQLAYWGEAVLLWDLLRRRGVDHVHVHFAANSSDIALIATRLGRAAGSGPRSFSLHLHGPTDFFDIERNRIALKAREAVGVICISDYARSQVLAWLSPSEAGKVVVARYGVALPAARERSPGDGPLRLLNVARLAPVKGHTVLLDALAEIRGRGVDATLDVVGGGPLREELAEHARRVGVADAVTWHGPLAHDRVAELYSAADVFCLPSFAEGLPVVLLEAMAAGLPVVATRITGVPEVVTDGHDGLLVAPGRADLVVGAIERLAGDPGLRVSLGANARATVSERYALERSNAAIHDALAAMVGRGA
jgi:colanic acid/amylovoran biosynthesis glycosyltransferase